MKRRTICWRFAAFVCSLSMLVAPLLARADTTGIVVSGSGGKDTVQFQQWQNFRRNVDEKSNGSLLLDYLIFGELGSPQSMLDAVQTGRASIGGFSCSGITQAIPELAVPQMPYLFASDEEADFVIDRYLTHIFSDILDSHGLVLLQWADYGFMDVFSKQPVALPKQLAGRQVRTASNIAGPIFLHSVGAIPVQIGITEIASSPQSDKIFAGLSIMQAYARLQSTFHYVAEAHQSFNCGMVIANKAWFESATPLQQQILRQAYPRSRETRLQARAVEKSLVDKFTAEGSVFLKLTAEQHNAWAAAGLPLYPAILQKAGGRSIEVYDLIRAGKQAFLRETPPDSHR